MSPAATPLEWKEVKNPRLRPNQYTIRNIFKRIDAIGDPWKGIDKHAACLIKVRKVLDKTKA